MNKEFVKKMIKAELLRYEAIKEILPDNMKKRVDNLEKEAASFLKDIALEIIKESTKEQAKEPRKETKKVKVDFQ